MGGFSEEIWLQMGEKVSIFNATWPQCDTSKLTGNTLERVVQINNKTKSKLWATHDLQKLN